MLRRPGWSESTCGSGATGRRGYATRPTNRMPAIINDVAMGYRMKGDEILSFMSFALFTRLWRALAGSGDRRRHRRAGLHLVLTRHYNTFARRKTLVDHGASIDRLGHLDLAKLGLAVGIDRECVKALASALNRVVRNHGCVFQRRQKAGASRPTDPATERGQRSEIALRRIVPLVCRLGC